jgi:hypothetical protein
MSLGIRGAELLPLNAPMADVLLLGPDGEVEFVAEISLSQARLTETSDPFVWENAMRAVVEAGVRVRCAGSLCGITWPG